ncbi:MATE family efflux transporter [Microvirga massiliensis]|uniref:MATE family efflux transporter n=1 Tax=Microvirga massiliensis TaxID=1033741 RepID=UPI00062B7A2F|nr:MATE family efflux transporter [Microvirga massiliensis]
MPRTPLRDDGSNPHFVSGSTMQHVLVMTGTGSIGLIAVFAVDFLSLLYVSWLDDPALTAGVGLATILLFLTTAINVGLMIAVGALVSRALGARDRERAQRLSASCLLHMTLASALVALVFMPFLRPILELLGAKGRTLDTAMIFLVIAMPTNPVMALGMGLSGVLRAAGDARRAMYVTLSAAAATAVLDPLLIFGLGLGVPGAAIALVTSRVISAMVGLSAAAWLHDLVARPNLRDAMADAPAMYAIALPAVLTNVATPTANSVFAGIMARFGEQAIAANAIVDRIIPVAFGGLFALSGAVGPILGQNWGSRRFDRMRQTLRDALIVAGLYVAAVWLILIALQNLVPMLFRAEGLTAELVSFFCLISGFVWFFIGLLFVANASFNNLGYPLLSTGFNWGRAVIGMVPAALAGAALAGPKGALLGIGIGSVPFGIAAILVAFGTIRRLEREATPPISAELAPRRQSG